LRQRGLELVKDEGADREKARAVRARQRAIGRELRRMYDGVAQEPVPSEFFDLLKRIDDSAGGSSKKVW
jgi:hypothetical protein